MNISLDIHDQTNLFIVDLVVMFNILHQTNLFIVFGHEIVDLVILQNMLHP